MKIKVLRKASNKPSVYCPYLIDTPMDDGPVTSK